MGGGTEGDLLAVPDEYDDAFMFLYRRGWTDGLPVVPPTPERVERMLSAVPEDPATVIAVVPPAQGEATLRVIAANAVMAGCQPEHLPVVVAAVRAMCRPGFNLAGIQGTTDPATPGLLLNGPIRQRLDVNCGESAAGPGRRANATIGRAIRLIMHNVGGGRPGTGDKAILGQPAKYTFCLGENEERSPWDPFHVDCGFSRFESTVTVVAVQYNHFISPCVRDADEGLRIVADGMAVMGNANVGMAGTPVTVVIPIAFAELLAKAGFSKQKVKEVLYERARIPVSKRPLGEKIWPYELLVVSDEILVVNKPESVLLFVAGGYGYSVLYLGGWYHASPQTEVIGTR